jgi:sugar lactone lactonase YvrE
MHNENGDRIIELAGAQYRALARFPRAAPPGWSLGEVAGVAVDSRDWLYVFHRGSHPVAVFDETGWLQHAWGDGLFQRPHGITIDRDDNLWLTDDLGHAVYKFTPRGQHLLTLGTPGRPSDTGIEGMDYRTIRAAAGPFHFPTNVAFAPDGSLYISDGYGNARIHHFSAVGRLLGSWGEPGDGPGQFHVPHGLVVDREGQVYVADRENSRIQVFTGTGDLQQTWDTVARPMQLALDANDRLWVAELGWRAGLWPWQAPAVDARPSACVSLFERSGRLIDRWGVGEEPTAPGGFFAPHDLCLDSGGSFYVGEVVRSAGGNRGLVSPDCHCLQKFVRL